MIIYGILTKQGYIWNSYLKIERTFDEYIICIDN